MAWCSPPFLMHLLLSKQQDVRLGGMFHKLTRGHEGKLLEPI